VTGSGLLALPDATAGVDGSATTVLLALTLGAAFMGQSNAIREIVKELPVYRRERAVGMSIVSYIASKAIVLGGITVAQAGVLVFLGTLRQDGPNDALVLGSAPLELFVGVALTGLAAMAFGLLVSSVVSTPDKALTLLPVLLLTQFLLAGPLFNLSTKPGLRELSYVTPTRWGFSALGATADVRHLPGGCEFGRAAAPDESAPGGGEGTAGGCDATWAHEASAWAFNLTALVALTVVPLWLSVLALRRKDPLRAWRAAAARGG
jgi:ABC-type transport system involved in multi-copper enzyme maturation permease subunit